MTLGRRWVVPGHAGRIALALLAALTLGLNSECRADQAPAATDNAAAATPAPADPSSPAPVRHHRGKHLTVAQSLDESVRRLSQALDLDSAQQETLRQILVDQHRHIAKLRSARPSASTDVTGATLAIYDQTKARIRGMLTDEQRKKYVADVPRGDLAPAQADLKHWMDLQESKRRQGQGEVEPK